MKNPLFTGTETAGRCDFRPAVSKEWGQNEKDEMASCNLHISGELLSKQPGFYCESIKCGNPAEITKPNGATSVRLCLWNEDKMKKMKLSLAIFIIADSC